MFVVHPFGLLADDAPQTGNQKAEKAAIPAPAETEVAVLNGTAAGPAPAPGLAKEVGDEVQAAGYRLGEVGDTTTPFPETIVMYARTQKEVGEAFAADLTVELNDPPVEVMTNEINSLAGDALIAVVVGDDAGG